jgi:hypothetical protein
MSSLPADLNASHDPHANASTIAAASTSRVLNPLWLLIFGGALFFAFAAALLASS